MKFSGWFKKAAKPRSLPDTGALGEELFTAAEQGDVAAVQKALSAGANVNYQRAQFGTPLVVAAGEGHSDIVGLLLQNKADVTACNMHDQTALHMAIRQNENSVIAVKLIDAGAPLDGRDRHGNTPAFYAAQNGRAKTLEALAAKGADFTIPNKKGVTPLMQATGLCHDDAIDVILKHPHNLDAQDDEGRTALMYAVLNRDVPLVQKYLSIRANFDVKDGHGNTAAAIARSLPDGRDVLKLLEEAAAARLEPFRTGIENTVTVMKKLTLTSGRGASP